MPDVSPNAVWGCLRTALDLVTEDELAAALDLKVSTLQNWRTEQIGPSWTKLGKSVFYRRCDVVDWVGSNVVVTCRTGAPAHAD